MSPVQRTVSRTLLVLVAMFAFAFALVPLYDVFCRVTGLNGKVDTTAQALVHEGVDESRYVTVQLVTRSGAGLPWRLEVEQRQLRMHPGQTVEVGFTFVNQGAAEQWGRAVPSVTPSQANRHLRKLSCFCFEEQRLAAGERLALPLVFQLDRDLPAEIHTVTLVYTLYPVASGELARRGPEAQGGEA